MRKGYGEYPNGWPEFAQQLKDECGWCCVRCGHQHDPTNGYCLTVHHATMNKAEPFDHWWAFLPLCQRCHLTIQAKVIMERIWYLPHSDWFKPYVAGWSAHVNHLPTDKEFVMQHIDELIAIGQGTLKVEEFIL